jgi:DNA-binding MarR family transcriptional regulator
MDRDRGVDIRNGIGDTLSLGASLLVQYVARGTSLTSRTVLATLEADGPTRLTALAAATGASQPSMTQLVGRLEREGLVTRLIDPDDARATLVAITADGQALRAELHQSQSQRLGELLDTLSAHDQATLGLAMHVALPLLQQLTEHAARCRQPEPGPGFTGQLTRSP